MELTAWPHGSPLVVAAPCPARYTAPVIESLAQRVRDLLIADGWVVNAGATAPELEEFERRHGVQLPGDYRIFLQHLNGCDGLGHRRHLRFWPVGELHLERWAECEALLAGGLPFIFADFLIQSDLYVMNLAASETYAHIYYWSHGMSPLARSFTEFLTTYMRTDDGLVLRSSQAE